MTTVFLPADRFVGRLVPNIVSPARCAELLADLDACGFARTGELYPRDYRNNDRVVFDDADLAAELCTMLREHVPNEIVDAGARWRLVGFNARLRACRYANGQSFCIHRDGAYVPSEDRRSFLTVQLYLDDDPHRTGGRTRFYADPQGRESWAAISPAAGSVIIFDHRVWHDGEPVTSGIKHVLRTDAIYERADDVVADDPNVVRRHRGYAWCAIACRDGSIASAGRDGTVRRNELVHGSIAGGDSEDRPIDVVHDLRDGSVTTIVEAADGSLWCGSRAGSIHRIDGAITRIADNHGAILASATSSPLVAFSTARGQVVACNANGRAWTIDAHDGWSRGICTHLDGFATCGDDGRVVLIDARGRAREHAQLPTPLRTLVSDGELIHVGDERGWIHTLAQDGSTLRSRRAHAGAVTSLALVDGVVVSAGEDGFIKRNDTVLAQLPDFVTSLAVAPEGLIVAGYDGAVRLLGQVDAPTQRASTL